jgi:DNA-directed RNA polymerase specialized sigma subunit
MNQEEERRLIKAYQEKQCKDSLTKLMYKYRWALKKLANKYTAKEYTQDLEQQVALKFCEAVKNFSLQKDYKFITYLYTCVHQGMSQYLCQLSYVVSFKSALRNKRVVAAIYTIKQQQLTTEKEYRQVASDYNIDYKRLVDCTYEEEINEDLQEYHQNNYDSHIQEISAKRYLETLTNKDRGLLLKSVIYSSVPTSYSLSVMRRNFKKSLSA